MVCSYLIRPFKNFLEEILTHKFFRYRSWFVAFFICSLEMVVGSLWKEVLTHYSCSLRPLWKEGLLTHYSCCLGPFESKLLTHYNCCWGPCESKMLIHYSCCWGHIWKQSTYTLQFLLGAPQRGLKAENLQLTHYSFF